MTNIYDSIRRLLTEVTEGDWLDEEDWLYKLWENYGLSYEAVLRRPGGASARSGAARRRGISPKTEKYSAPPGRSASGRRFFRRAEIGENGNSEKI